MAKIKSAKEKFLAGPLGKLLNNNPLFGIYEDFASYRRQENNINHNSPYLLHFVDKSRPDTEVNKLQESADDAVTICRVSPDSTKISQKILEFLQERREGEKPKVSCEYSLRHALLHTIVDLSERGDVTLPKLDPEKDVCLITPKRVNRNKHLTDFVKAIQNERGRTARSGDVPGLHSGVSRAAQKVKKEIGRVKRIALSQKRPPNTKKR